MTTARPEDMGQDLKDAFEAWPLYTVFRVKWGYGQWSPLMIKITEEHARPLYVDDPTEEEELNWMADSGVQNYERKS